jgi:predicted DNA-binding protein
MIRTQIQLTEEQNELLRELSKTTREPIAALIRKAVDQFLLTRRPDRFYLYRQAESVIGKYEAGVEDVSINHDKYLEEAFEA